MTDRLREPAGEGTLAEQERRKRASAPTLRDLPLAAPALARNAADVFDSSQAVGAGSRTEES